jgi:hypothetical protein
MGPVIFRNDPRGNPDLDPDRIRTLLRQAASGIVGTEVPWCSGGELGR